MFDIRPPVTTRKVLDKALQLIMMIASALMIWKGLAFVTNTESPIVVVLSESMEPAFQRGDLLFLSLTESPIQAGDICVFKIPGRVVPIVHRAIAVHTKNGTEYVLTKGDNNKVDDRGLYARGMKFIERKHVIGRVQGLVPYIGMITIAVNDWDNIRYQICRLTKGEKRCSRRYY